MSIIPPNFKHSFICPFPVPVPVHVPAPDSASGSRFRIPVPVFPPQIRARLHGEFQPELKFQPGQPG